MSENRIGIIGDGQLGRMMTIPALEMGFNVSVLGTTDNSPAAQVGATQIFGDLKDAEAIRTLGELSDAKIAEYFKNLNNGPKIHVVASGAFPLLPARIESDTLEPVITVPISGSPIEGLAVLFALGTSPQIPSPTFVGLNTPENAAMLAVRMLALNDPGLAERHRVYREGLIAKVAGQNEWLQNQ